MKITDPVCGKTIVLETVEAHMEFKGWSYFFCSKTCLNCFQREPDQFVEERSGAPPSIRRPGG